MQVLRLLIRLYAGVPSPDYLTICQCLMFLDDAAEVRGRLTTGCSLAGPARRCGKPRRRPSAHPWYTPPHLPTHLQVAQILHTLLGGGEDQALMAFQIGFDLVEAELQSFLIKASLVGAWLVVGGRMLACWE